MCGFSGFSAMGLTHLPTEIMFNQMQIITKIIVLIMAAVIHQIIVKHTVEQGGAKLIAPVEYTKSRDVCCILICEMRNCNMQIVSSFRGCVYLICIIPSLNLAQWQPRGHKQIHSHRIIALNQHKVFSIWDGHVEGPVILKLEKYTGFFPLPF